MAKLAAHRYAKALWTLASEKDLLDQITSDIKLVDQTIKDSKDLKILLRSPVIKTEQKRSCLKAIFKAVHKDVLHFFNVLFDNNRINILAQVTEAFISKVNEMNNVTSAEVTTSVPLTEDMEHKIQVKIKELTGNQATLIKKIDKDLIGGFLLRVGDLQYDASISGRLNSLKHKFKQNSTA